MTKLRYLARFRHALRGLPAHERAEILKDIEASLVDFQGPNSELESRFGKPEELAAQYLQDRDLVLPLGSRIFSLIARYALATIGGVTALVLSTLGVAYFGTTADSYNYASAAAGQAHWSGASHNLRLFLSDTSATVEQAPLALDLFQSDLVLHGISPDQTDKGLTDELICKGRPLKINALQTIAVSGAAPLPIHQMTCSLFLADRKVAVNVLQATLTLNDPQADLIVTGTQATIDLAIQDNAYQLDILGVRALLPDLPISNPNADVKIEIQSEEVSVNRYTY